MFLSLHQEWQERVRVEIVEVCGDQDIQQFLQHKDTLPKLITVRSTSSSHRYFTLIYMMSVT